MRKTWFLMLCIVLAGCAAKPQHSAQPVATPAPVQPLVTPEPQPVAATSNDRPASDLTANKTCVKSLTTLQAYSPKTASRYTQEMRQLTRKTSQFLSVKEDLATQSNELVLDAYRSRMNTLCYRIETTLGQAMIAQANL